jgi:hypothetical protein
MHPAMSEDKKTSRYILLVYSNVIFHRDIETACLDYVLVNIVPKLKKKRQDKLMAHAKKIKLDEKSTSPFVEWLSQTNITSHCSFMTLMDAKRETMFSDHKSIDIAKQYEQRMSKWTEKLQNFFASECDDTVNRVKKEFQMLCETQVFLVQALIEYDKCLAK